MQLIGAALGAAAWVITAGGVVYGALLLARGPHHTPPVPARPVDSEAERWSR